MDPEALRNCTTRYEEQVRVCSAKLVRVLKDIGDDVDPAVELGMVASRAVQVWSTAVEDAEGRRAALQAEVDAVLREVWGIKVALGLQGPGTPHHEDPVPCGETIRKSLVAASSLLATWRKRKAERQQEVDGIQSVNVALRHQLGLPLPAMKPDLTQAGLDFAHLERERLLAEQVRRISQLHEEMAKLRAICADVLGEDTGRTAAEVHPSLRHYSFADGVEGSADPSSGPLDNAALAAHVDLSAATMEGLAAKAKELQGVKAEREAQLQQLEDVLVSLWDAAGVAAAAPERATFVAAMVGPTRLHTANMEKVLAEVHRLEECRAQAMRDLTLTKARELQAACAATHIPAPPLQAILADLSRRPGPASGGSGGDTPPAPPGATPGQISECLARVVRALSEVAAEAERRRPIVAAIEEAAQARAEEAWLREYEADVNRFKGRDANARLQRSLRATRMRESLPGLLAGLQRALESWALTEGCPFLYDGEDYRPTLQAAQQQVAEQAEADAAHKANLRAAVTANKTSSGTRTPPAGGARMSTSATPGALKRGGSVHLDRNSMGSRTPPARAAVTAKDVTSALLRASTSLSSHSKSVTLNTVGDGSGTRGSSRKGPGRTPARSYTAAGHVSPLRTPARSAVTVGNEATSRYVDSTAQSAAKVASMRLDDADADIDTARHADQGAKGSSAALDKVCSPQQALSRIPRLTH